jgi:hypothetical protein
MKKEMRETDNSLFPRGKDIDISSEIYRTYRFPGGEKIKINEPKTLRVTDNGHRIIDSRGNSHYIPYGWIHIFWKVREGERNFHYQRSDKEKELLVEEDKK